MKKFDELYKEAQTLEARQDTEWSEKNETVYYEFGQSCQRAYLSYKITKKEFIELLDTALYSYDPNDFNFKREEKKMKKASVITKVSISGESYLAIYESGKTTTGKLANMPRTVKTWLEQNTETVEPEETHVEAVTAPATGEAVEVAMEETKEDSDRVSVIDTATGEDATDLIEVEQKNPPAAYMAMDIDREDIRAIAREGIEAAVFAGAATVRLFTCIGLAGSWIARKVKAGFQAAANTILFGITVVLNAVIGWIDAAFRVSTECYEFCAALFTEIRNILAPAFWGVLDAAGKAWEFREELVRES